jgi:hypothetical protein
MRTLHIVLLLTFAFVLLSAAVARVSYDSDDSCDDDDTPYLSRSAGRVRKTNPSPSFLHSLLLALTGAGNESEGRGRQRYSSGSDHKDDDCEEGRDSRVRPSLPPVVHDRDEFLSAPNLAAAASRSRALGARRGTPNSVTRTEQGKATPKPMPSDGVAAPAALAGSKQPASPTDRRFMLHESDVMSSHFP